MTIQLMSYLSKTNTQVSLIYPSQNPIIFNANAVKVYIKQQLMLNPICIRETHPEISHFSLSESNHPGRQCRQREGP